MNGKKKLDIRLLSFICFFTAATNASEEDATALSWIRVDPISYGQSLEAPLPSLGRSIDFVDWDGDGLLDLVSLAHPRYTAPDYRTGWSKLILLRNTGSKESPLFASAEQHRTVLQHPLLGFHFALIDFDGDGRKEVVSVKDNVLRIFQPSTDPFTPDWRVLECIVDGSANSDMKFDVQEASPTLGVIDWNEDGREDILFGINQHSVMKRGFGVDYDTKQPMAARIYVALNNSTGVVPRFGKPFVVEADEKEIECFGWVYPVSCDIDGDGASELVVNDHAPGIRVFKRTGKDSDSKFTYQGTIEEEGVDLEATSLAFQSRPVDLDGDGRDELVTTSYFGSPSLLQWYRHKEGESATEGWCSEGFLKMKAHSRTPLVGPGISTPEPVDWDGDGDTDLLLGGEPGTPMIAINIGSEANKVFAAPERLRFKDGSLLETYSSELGDGSHHGPKEWFDDRSTPRAVDWDKDGILDIVSGTQGRRLYWMRGVVVSQQLRFERPRIFTLRGEPLLHPHRCLPAISDWDGDGFLDIVGFNVLSDLVIFIGHGDSDLQSSTPLCDTAGGTIGASPLIKHPDFNKSRSGRSGVAAFDWDGDGQKDLITYKHYFDGRVLFYKRVDEQNFEPAVELFEFFSHLAGPSIVDWDQDGYPDILMGGDYRRLVGLSYQMPNEDRAHYFIYNGKSLPVPSSRIRE